MRLNHLLTYSTLLRHLRLGWGTRSTTHQERYPSEGVNVFSRIFIHMFVKTVVTVKGLETKSEHVARLSTQVRQLLVSNKTSHHE